MKKTIAAVVFLGMIGFTAYGWFALFGGQAKDMKTYNAYLEKAAKFESKEIYIDALNCYKDALKMNPNDRGITQKIADMYYRLGDFNGFITTCDQLIDLNPSDPKPYLDEIHYYIEKSNYADAIKVLRSAQKRVGDNAEIAAIQKELSTKCVEKYVSFGDVQDWFEVGNTTLIVAGANDKWGIALKDGSRFLRPNYDYVGTYDEETGFIPICYEGRYYYVDYEGNRRLIGDEEYQFLGGFHDGFAAAQRQGNYGYVDIDFNEYHFEYEYSGEFANGIAAVKKDGRWALIDSKFNYLTGYDFDEILVDSYGRCAAFGLVVARSGDEYFFLNNNGKRISSRTFNEAVLPADDESLIAVRDGELWGFADHDGAMIIEPQYQNAKSFCLGLAPVKVNDDWGYIDLDKNIVIECKYKDAGVFSKAGAAPVYNGYSWMFLVLCEYED